MARFSRWVIAAVAGLALIMGAGMVQPPSASASSDWCWDDPIVNVLGYNINVNVGVKGNPTAVRQNVKNAHTIVYLPTALRGMARIAGYTNVYFKESAEIQYVSWLAFEPGRKVEAMTVTTFTMAPGSPVFEAKVDVSYMGKSYASANGKTNTNVTLRKTLGAQ